MPYKTLSRETGSSDDIFHKEIVDTFFGKVQRQEISDKNPPQNNLRKPAQPPKTAILIKLSYVFFGLSLVFFISGALFFLAAKGLPPFGTRETNRENINYARLFSDGRFNHDVVDSFSYEGDAKSKSLIMGDSIKLVNEGNTGWARATFTLKEPGDFTKANLLLQIKSRPGAKNVTITLQDTMGNLRRSAIRVSPSWEIKNTTFKGKNYFDLRKVKSVSLDFGESTGNSRGSEIFVKELGARHSEN